MSIPAILDLGNCVNAEPNVPSEATPRYLDWSQRTPDIQKKIK